MPWEKQFNEEEVLDRAMGAFWARGYEATSVNDLLTVMEINRGSLYAAFTDKRSLFIRALKSYDEKYRRDFLTSVARNYSPKEAIFAAFEDVVESSDGGRNRKGCLLVNTALELSPHDPEVEKIVRGSLREVENFFCEMIVAAQGEGTIRTEVSSREVAQALLGLFLGLRVLVRSRPEKDVMKTILNQARALID
ncbi:TetR/AcrR family transcriptional regulator [Pelagibius sp. Alg239-R121]|uniref:TetR/AcrR family transcriptional regulator n=1 Tax=Pelagibius sp. Alg239-R121 TaxID=2993448 RepID=UPI0024A674A4|nr:TetR/AcrR family transcriptional regulator [Pelagibius sp. Alg239-R121]